MAVLDPTVHDGRPCARFYLTGDADVEPCGICETSYADVYDTARAFFRPLATRHAERGHSATPGCPGLDVFECHGSCHHTKYGVLREDDCGVFEDDDAAATEAIRLYVAAGYHVVDAPAPGPCGNGEACPPGHGERGARVKLFANPDGGAPLCVTCRFLADEARQLRGAPAPADNFNAFVAQLDD